MVRRRVVFKRTGGVPADTDRAGVPGEIVSLVVAIGKRIRVAPNCGVPRFLIRWSRTPTIDDLRGGPYSGRIGKKRSDAP